MLTKVTHDALFKSAFSDPQAVVALVAPSLPSALVRHTDWSSLSPVSTNLVGRSLDQKQCDLVFSAPLRWGERSGTLLLHLHIEHQSKNDPSMVLRTLDYGGSLLLTHHRNYGKDSARPHPPLLVPVVVSHDPKGWSAVTRLEELYDLNEELRAATQPFRTQHGYLLIDLCSFDDDLARERASDGFRHLVLVALREARKGRILQHLAALADIIDGVAKLPHGTDHFWELTCYICHVSRHPDVTPETVTASLASASPAAKGAAAESWARITEQLLTEGREEGREEGRLEERAENRALFCGTLLGIVQERFGPISAAQKARIESASIAEVQGWIMTCATDSCGTLNELLGQHQ